MTIHRLGRRAAPALLIAVSLSACAVFRKEAPITPEIALVRGLTAYRAHRYDRAAGLIKTWVDANAAGDPRMPGALIALGNSHIKIGEYLTASSELLRLVTDYPQAPEQQEARFRLCEAYRGLSPRAQLDQQYTETAITYCQSYAGYYPQTPQADTARTWVTDMRDKLAYKAYLNGVFYMRRQAWDAAVIYFNDAVNGYPETKWAPAALARVVETYGRIGYREEAEEARQRLLRDFPQSPEAQTLAAAPPVAAARRDSAAAAAPAPPPTATP
ncbi:MAG TPA: outer membrane protein assembly factor BamD [Longimicrobium sp.]|nr:outer membrane protein assembly factor BamD [Longimicrobium sp.]